MRLHEEFYRIAYEQLAPVLAQDVAEYLSRTIARKNLKLISTSMAGPRRAKVGRKSKTQRLAVVGNGA